MAPLYEKNSSTSSDNGFSSWGQGTAAPAGFPSWGNRQTKKSASLGPKPTKKAPKPSNSNNSSPARQDSLARRAQNSSKPKTSKPATPATPAKPAKPITPAKPVTPTTTPTATLPTFDQWAMKDSAYQQAMSDYNLQLSNSQNAHDTNIAAAGQDQTNQLSDWQTQYDRGSQGLLDDFAARGLGNSGLYADANQKYVADAESQKQSIMDTILRRIQGSDSELAGNRNVADQTLQQAKLEAARRGAGQFSGTV